MCLLVDMSARSKLFSHPRPYSHVTFQINAPIRVCSASRKNIYQMPNVLHVTFGYIYILYMSNASIYIVYVKCQVCYVPVLPIHPCTHAWLRTGHYVAIDDGSLQIRRRHLIHPSASAGANEGHAVSE